VNLDVQLKGLDEARKSISHIPEVVDEAAMFAVNDSAEFAQSESSRRIREQVAFSARYIGSAQDPSARLRVSKRARTNDLEAAVAGRMRPTSLAQFAVGAFVRGKPVRVRVSPGRTSKISNAFPIKLRRGTGVYDPENANVGLALRLKAGESVRNKREMVQISGNLYLLYGPSVDQVFRDVRFEVQAPVSEHL
jgi:hypothetical protein